jgi:hypothetical protein
LTENILKQVLLTKTAARVNAGIERPISCRAAKEIIAGAF